MTNVYDTLCTNTTKVVKRSLLHNRCAKHKLVNMLPVPFVAFHLLFVRLYAHTCVVTQAVVESGDEGICFK